MDYRDLLARYIQHIVGCEGTDYISGWVGYNDCPQFTQEEWTELERLSEIACERLRSPKP
jgi:hypothetical protein